MNRSKAVRVDTSIEDRARYLETHYPNQRALLTTPEAVKAGYSIAREAERVRAIRLLVGTADPD
ncbi:MAG: hypothetical protein WAP03_25475 [Methylorubrum rhodinum]|uniref:hypothetical protein n=1 Tax=Methylorubrum rhodinum TaxID=29428 RepID=UPI003BB0FBE5